MFELMLPFLGFLIGILAALTGIGGGVFIVPLLTLFYSFQPANASGTSLTTIIFTAVAATLNYSRQKRIFYRTGLALAITTAPGAFLGAYFTTIIPANLLGLIFGVFLILVALRIMITSDSLKQKLSGEKRKGQLVVKSDRELIASRMIVIEGAFLGFFGGLAAGLLGIGGGVLVVPIMTLAMHMPIHVATATSMFTMIFTSVSGVTQHYLSNHINFEYALLLAVGAIFGAQVGAYVSRRVSNKNLRRIFAIVLIVVSVQMILKYA